MGLLNQILSHAQGESKLNEEHNKSRQKKLLKHYLIPKKPDGSFSAKLKAELLLMDAKHLASKINYCEDLEEFEMSFEKLVDTLQQLIWLNEKGRIPMYGVTPRDNLKQILSNMEATINDFIKRARRHISFYGQNEAEDYASLAQGIETSDIFCPFLTSENREKISLLYADSEKIQNQRHEAELLRKRKEEERARQYKRQATLNEIGKSAVDLSNFDDPMDVIVALETRISFLYNYFLENACSAEQGKELFSAFRDACQTSKLPLAAEVRLEALLMEYEPRFSAESPLYAIDQMEGHDFERWCAALLKRNGFTNVEVTQGSGDQGVDIIAEKDGIRYAIQCKCYSADLGNKPIQEVHTGKAIYHCQVGAVMTNRYFTTGAKEAAKATGTLLWDRDKLKEMLGNAEE